MTEDHCESGENSGEIQQEIPTSSYEITQKFEMVSIISHLAVL